MTRTLMPRQVQEMKRALAQIDDAVATLETELDTAKGKPLRRASAA